MKTKIKQLYNNPLISGSAIIFSGTLFANFLSFIFNWFMRRELTNADYGAFASMMSLITLPGLATAAVIPVVVNFAGIYFSKNQFDLVRGLYKYILKVFLVICLSIFVIFLVFINQVGSFLHITNIYLLLLTDFIILFNILFILNQTFLQAKLAFSFIAFTSVFSAILKLTLGVLFVLLGLQANGAIGAVLAAFIFPYLATFLPLRKLLVKDSIKPNINFKEMFSYGIPSAVVMLGCAALISTDLLLVKHFFRPEDAGIYAGLSLAARVIFFFTAPIGTVMFPLIVQKYNRSEKYKNTFFLSLALIIISSFGLTAVYFLFPKYILAAFNLHSPHLKLISLLTLFAVFISLYSLVSIITSFYLSIRKTIIYLPIIITAILQVIGIWLYHKTFQQVIGVSLILTFLLLILLLLYYPYATKKQ
jgi:O-antigen/teichoic acid export membrane protein